MKARKWMMEYGVAMILAVGCAVILGHLSLFREATVGKLHASDLVQFIGYGGAIVLAWFGARQLSDEPPEDWKWLVPYRVADPTRDDARHRWIGLPSDALCLRAVLGEGRQGRLQLGLRRGTHRLLRMADYDLAAEMRFSSSVDGDTPAEKSRLDLLVRLPHGGNRMLAHHTPLTISIIRFSTQYRSSCARVFWKNPQWPPWGGAMRRRQACCWITGVTNIE